MQLPDGSRLQLTPQLADQELYFPADGSQKSEVRSQTSVDSNQVSGGQAMAYWEGAVSVTGDRTGVGYVELTAYVGR